MILPSWIRSRENEIVLQVIMTNKAILKAIIAILEVSAIILSLLL